MPPGSGLGQVKPGWGGEVDCLASKAACTAWRYQLAEEQQWPGPMIILSTYEGVLWAGSGPQAMFCLPAY